MKSDCDTKKWNDGQTGQSTGADAWVTPFLVTQYSLDEYRIFPLFSNFHLISTAYFVKKNINKY